MPAPAEPAVSTAARSIPGDAPEPGPYRRTFAACVGSALAAGWITALVDVRHTLREPHAGGGGRFAVIVLALFGVTALIFGVAQAVIAGAITATHPGGVRGFFRRLSDDEPFDTRVTGALLAAAVVAVLYTVSLAALAMLLVAERERKTVGALLLGGAATALLPVFVLLAWPAYRLTRHVARALPRFGPIPAAVVLVVGAAGSTALFLVYYIATRLDWRALPLGGPFTLLAFLLLQGLLLALAYGPLDALRTRVPARGALVVAAAVAAAALPILSVPGALSESTVKLLLDARGGKTLVALARHLFDRDHDGYSSILGGGDCNDHDPRIHPGAIDIPDDGIDQDCEYGDEHAAAAPTGDAVAGKIPENVPAAPPAFRWNGNILVIAVDTLRADRLGVAGYTRRGGKSLTPRIDALAARGVRFTHVYAQAPNTPRSFPAMFTSRFPSKIAWEKPFANFGRLLPANVSVWQKLSDAGLRTIGEASHFYFVPEFGITRGFDEFDDAGATNLLDSNHDSASPRIVPRVEAKLGELAKSKTRFALFVHLFEPHSTYMEHAGFPIHEHGEAGLEEKYDMEIAFVDGYVGKILDALAASGLADGTLVVLVSDHGEAFGVHKAGGERLFFHGQSLYDELLRVPLIVVAPGLAPRTVDDPIMIVDLAPTLLDLVGAAIPPEFMGRSVVPLLSGGTLSPRPIYAELLPAPNWNHEGRALVSADGKTKIVQRTSDGVTEIYDLAADPTEVKDLAGDAPLAERMKKELASFRARMEAPPAPAPTPAPAPPAK